MMSVEKWSQWARAARDITVHVELKLVLRVNQASREMLGDVSARTSSWLDGPWIVEKARLANHDWHSAELDALCCSKFGENQSRLTVVHRARSRLPAFPITRKYKNIAPSRNDAQSRL